MFYALRVDKEDVAFSNACLLAIAEVRAATPFQINQPRMPISRPTMQAGSSRCARSMSYTLYRFRNVVKINSHLAAQVPPAPLVSSSEVRCGSRGRQKRPPRPERGPPPADSAATITVVRRPA